MSNPLPGYSSSLENICRLPALLYIAQARKACVAHVAHLWASSSYLELISPRCGPFRLIVSIGIGLNSWNRILRANYSVLASDNFCMDKLEGYARRSRNHVLGISCSALEWFQLLWQLLCSLFFFPYHFRVVRPQNAVTPVTTLLLRTAIFFSPFFHYFRLIAFLSKSK